ncbi:erythromycin esterase family protein [Streptomyces sp. SP17BM10]|uniref:erythromycin esterase family protein n=1 Tax=Streptomyces sp. SP17BM10 TaxID=3002530 RepID=UPI002E787DA9|nr:erythromycin esterase family protein [Streptomyces sp. SP17BM10]MEE1783703.1 erythromycin esterase family protein [Streptomyces sp. SP17BM10]
MTASIRDAARPFSGHALTSLLSPATRLLGLGEPTHGVEAFPELRNELFRHLVEHEGYRSIAIESDCLAGLAVDAYVTDGIGTLDDAVAHGFSHGFGASPANRELLRWMREFNRQQPHEEQVRFYGFDGPLEITGAAGPRQCLIALHDYLAAHLDPPYDRAALEVLLGDDGRWTDEAIMYDPAKSVGRTAEARELRVMADDLSALLTAHAPRLTAAGSPGAFWRAELHARTATGLLRYHAAMADTGPDRIAMLLSQRDAMMADNLDAVLRREERRGPTLAYAHNAHLQREESSMRFAGRLTRWWSAGALVGTRLGDRYAYAATTFGSRGCDVPPADTLEGLLSTLPHDRSVLDPAQLGAVAADLTPRVPADHTYAALDPATTGQADAIVFVRDLR